MGTRYLCTECGNIFDTDYVDLRKDIYGDYLCPVRECAGAPFAIDEMMIHPITELNKRGIITYKCCSGHIDDKFFHPYILISGKTPTRSKPDFWTVDTNTETIENDFEVITTMDVALRYHEDEPTKPYTKERLESIHKAMMSLYDWVDRKLKVDYTKSENNNH